MKKFIKILIVLFIIFIGCLLYSRFIATKGLITREYKVVSTKITDNFHGIKIVHISDIHYGSTIFEKELEKLTNEIIKLKPDIVVLTGDLIDDNPYNKDIIIKYLSLMPSKLGKFAVSGNHDNIDEFNDIIEKSGFVNLDDDYRLIYNKSNEPIIISGISSNYYDASKLDVKTEKFNNYFNNNLEDPKPIYSILLMHEPDYVDNLNLDNYDLILSGHSHGGQVRIPLIGKIYTPLGSKNYYDEYYKVNNTDLYISYGLGTSKVKLRLFNRPSINFYRITNKWFYSLFL